MVASISRSRKELSEILHIAPLRKGYVPASELGVPRRDITFADRLKIVLESSNKREDAGFPSVIRNFRGIHTAKWALLDGDTRLILSVVFDGEWHDYLAGLTFVVPGFLHLVWSNCEGWEDVAGSPEKLFRFIQAHQVRVPFFYAQHPELTARDIDWLEALRKNSEDAQKASPPKPTNEPVLTPQTFAERRAAALSVYLPDQLDIAKRLFRETLQSLYAKEYFDRAFDETFGP